ncbi:MULTISPECIES: ABC transporter substrate-binding protein [Cellulomonas]|jgi:polar amino acid transport system substrate-binding protein|uniref:Polar amino acid transport system substrate-binding protein n=1 Tax=Cellulomonas iranensis TaxID=76862 RepID=A0ABU0GM56_9CELL|nr:MULTISPECIES: ABC transporter substrate-binding protein [Cellulomonas]MBO9568669.1 ABC transporter substrate-binding protein [Cellulomonas iranensis]MDQ0426438.1 polar amino acid transport system substrate-binding protein [Cellulomonas iranensis]TFH74105.1 ABC transporter substrate-binding protein [Cellulomonas sp. HD19AZ1]UCN15842.1 ABC transporter substrate-binding protein [Cellulomonas iranensis]
MTPSRRAAAPAAAATLLLALAACTSTSDAAEAPASQWSDLADSAACADLREAHPDLVGTTQTNAINPHTPGYEVIDPENPDRFMGFDIDLGEAIGACLGFDVDYVAVGFSELIPTVASGQADWIVSNLYATQERAAGGVDFISYSKVFDGVLVAKGNPEGITGIDTSLCGLTVALNKGYVEVPLVEAVAPDCTAAGLAAPEVALFDSSADCVQAILAGRADAYMNDINTVNRFIAEHPDDLDSAETVMLDYEIGIGVLQGEHEFRDAVQAALTVVQDTGLQTELAEKWELDANAVAEPTVLSVG